MPRLVRLYADRINIDMPETDYLKYTLDNILSQISEVKELISLNSKESSDFKDDILKRLQELELRVNTLETEKRVVSTVLGSGIVQKILTVAGVALVAYVGAHTGTIASLLSIFSP